MELNLKEEHYKEGCRRGVCWDQFCFRFSLHDRARMDFKTKKEKN